MSVLERIKFGHKNALKRSGNQFKDRAERREIERANAEGDCIINVGRGYYRPIPGDPVDDKEFEEYMAGELSRARKILNKRMKMRATRERWRECGIQTDNTRAIVGTERVYSS